MLKRHVFSIFLVMTSWSAAMAVSPVSVVEEKQLLFTDIKDGRVDRIQTATQFVPAVEAAKIPRYMDIYGVAKNTEGIRNIIVVRSSFYLPLSINEIRQRMSSPLEVSRYSKNLKVKSCAGSECAGEIKTSMASLAISLRYGSIDKSHVPTEWETAFLVLHYPDLIAAQEFTQIESVFARGGSYTAFYKMGDNLTWAQSYQVFSAKESAYAKARLIPFLNLDKTIRNTIRDLLMDARSSILQEQVYASLVVGLASRMPAANGYDKDLYTQKSYRVIDPEGDAALIERAAKVPMNALKALFQNDDFGSITDPWQPEPWEMVEPLAGKNAEPVVKGPGPSIQGRDKPIKPEEFTEMMKQVLREEAPRGNKATVGIFHRWAPETVQNAKSPVLVFSKLFVVLSMGFSSRFMTTGHETDLWKWIVAQDYNSITFPEMFRASLRIHRGDVYLALLTIENLLSANWRYGGRENMPVTKRLRPITSGYNYSEDKYGTWYHFYGMILYGYVTGSGFKSSFVGRSEALGSNMLSPGVDKTQKQWFNKMGGFIGADLREAVASGSYLREPFHPAALKEDYYLNRSEDFRDRLPVRQSAVLSAQIRRSFDDTSSSIRIENMGDESFANCVVEVMVDKGAGYYSPFKYTILNVTLPARQQTELSLAEAPPRGVRLFVSSCQQGSDQQLEVRDRHWSPPRQHPH